MISARLPGAPALPAGEPSAPGGRAPGERAFALAAPAVLALGYALRLVHIGELRVWGDGAYSVFLATRDLPDLLARTAVDSHPPLYYLLLKGWLAVAGWTELSARWLSLAAGVLAIALTYSLGRRLFGRATGAGAALLLAFSPFALYFARLPRMYAQLLCLALLLAYLADRLARPGRGRRRLAIAFGATAAATLYTHYYGALAVGAAVAYVVLATIRGRVLDPRPLAALRPRTFA
jgi:uncharacterized membrane protein